MATDTQVTKNERSGITIADLCQGIEAGRLVVVERDGEYVARLNDVRRLGVRLAAGERFTGLLGAADAQAGALDMLLPA